MQKQIQCPRSVDKPELPPPCSGGVGIGRAVAEFRAYAEASGIPVVATLKGLGAVPTRDPHFVGMLGMHGMVAANYTVQESDLLICVGARFDDRATGRLDGFAPNARVIHLDADAAEIGTIENISDELFSTWLLPFEATVLLLTIAAVGTIGTEVCNTGAITALEK